MRDGKSIILNVKFGVLSQIIKIILQFVSRKVFIYFLGVELLGVNSLFASILSILSMTELGVGSAIAYSLYKPIAENNENKIAGIMHLYRKIYRIIGFVIFAFGVVLLPFIPEMINTNKNIPYVRLMFFIVLAKTSLSYFLYSYSQTLLIASEKKYEVDKIVSIFYIVTNVCEILVLFLTHSFIAYLIIEMICLISQQFIIYRKAYNQYPSIMCSKGIQLERNEKKEIWKNVYGLSINKFAGAILGSIDNIIISTLISTAVVGMYSNYTMILAAATGIISMAFSSITANIGRKFADSSIKESHFYLIFYLNFLICGFSTSMYFLLINDFISITFGQNLVLDNITVFAISINTLISYMGQSIQVFKDASGIFWFGKYRPLITCLLNIIFSIVLGKYFGISGIIFATVISRVLTTTWFDPYIVFKHAFNRGTLNYWLRYIYYVIVIIFSTLLVSLLFNILNITGITLFGFIIKSLFSMILCFILMMAGTIWMNECKVLIKMVIRR